MQNNLAPRAAPAAGDAPGLTSEQGLLVTKLVRPSVGADLVPRPRLLNRLQQGIQRPLILVAAPAGFGKTTLLSTWLEHAPLRSAWVTLEHDDDDLTRFWSYVFTALARVQPGSSAAALALLQAPPFAPLPPVETALTAWINALATLPHEVALVLDDYHVITAPPIHRSVTYLVDHLPRQLHLVMATRADPPLPLARLRARGHLTEIRAADLRFTAEETATFLTRGRGLELADADIAALAARTEGWIAGLQLAALSLHGHADIAGFLQAFTGSHRYIIDYLVEEVLARQPEPVQRFLLQTAILERLEGSLCEAVMGGMRAPGGEAGGHAMLEQLEQANLFLMPLDDGRRWYRYHQLFAEALRHRLQHQQPALVPELHRRASRWYEQYGLMGDAVHHALAAADFEQAARLMEQAGNDLVRQGEIATLHRWVAALPDALVRSRIEIAVWQGWLLFVSGKHDEALQHLEDIERRFGINGGADDAAVPPAMLSEAAGAGAIRGRIAAIRASIALIQRDFPRAITLSRLALAYLPQESLARAYVAWYLGKAHWLNGAMGAASVALAEAAQVSWEVHHLHAFFLVTHDLAHVQILEGHLHQADQTYRRALGRALAPGGPQPAMGPAYVGRGHLEREWNHPDVATALLQEGIALCTQTGNMQVILEAYVALAFIRQEQGDAGGAGALMQQAAKLWERQHQALPSGTQVAATQAWLFLMQGDEAAALGWAGRSGLRVDQELHHEREREYLTFVRVLIVQRRLDEAMKWLANLLQTAEAQGRTGSVIEICMLQAAALHAAGAVNPALEQLARALALAEPEGYIRLFVDEGAPIAHLLVQLRARGPGHQWGSPHYREQLLALLGRAHDEAVSPAAVAVPGSGTDLLGGPLSERELEVLRLIVAGCSNREIADRLVIAVSTVKWYVNAIFGKLQVESRTKAIVRARDLHIV